MQRVVRFVASLELGVVLLALSAGRGAAAAPSPTTSVTIYIVQHVRLQPPTWGYDRMSITIPPGTTVTWKSVPGNSERHTSTSYDDVWNSPFLNPGDAWSFTFAKAGRYRYHCTPHPWMVGVVDVVAGASLPPAIFAPEPRPG